MMVPDKEIYLQNIKADLRRTLGLLNRAPYSEKRGSFHRNYWHHRQSGFPSAISQLGVQTLALAYKNNFEGNIIFNDKSILQYIESSLEYCTSIQKKDGSYDEWYLNERGWAGPTGYITNAQVQTIILLKDQLSSGIVDETLRTIDKSATFLGKFWEEQILSNHIAMAILPVGGAYKLTNERKHLSSYNKLFDEFLRFHHSEEGWGLEYDGPDVGYQTATISFLGKVHKIHQDERILPVIEKSLEFVQYFLYPDYSFSNDFGSRSTSNFFVHGPEYWGRYFNQAQQLAGQVRLGLEKEKMLRPGHCEDHYFLYRLPEFLEAYLDAQGQITSSEEKSKCNNEFTKAINKAKIHIHSTPELYAVTNMARGGLFQSYRKGDDHFSERNLNHGWYIVSNKKKIFSNINAFEIEYKIENDSISLSGFAGVLREDFFTPLTHLIFNLVMMIFGWNKAISYFIKSVIRKRLMFSNQEKTVKFERIISFRERKITDNIYINDIDILKGGYSNNIQARYVPQSKYFLESDKSERGLSLKEIDQLNKERKITLQMDF